MNGRDRETAAESLRRAGERSSESLDARVADLEREVATLRAGLEALWRGDRVELERELAA